MLLNHNESDVSPSPSQRRESQWGPVVRRRRDCGGGSGLQPDRGGVLQVCTPDSEGGVEDSGERAPSLGEGGREERDWGGKKYLQCTCTCMKWHMMSVYFSNSHLLLKHVHVRVHVLPANSLHIHARYCCWVRLESTPKEICKRILRYCCIQRSKFCMHTRTFVHVCIHVWMHT